MTLDCVKPGQGGIITVVGGDGALRRRLLDMGLTPKTKVMVRKVAPMSSSSRRPRPPPAWARRRGLVTFFMP